MIFERICGRLPRHEGRDTTESAIRPDGGRAESQRNTGRPHDVVRGHVHDEEAGHLIRGGGSSHLRGRGAERHPVL